MMKALPVTLAAAGLLMSGCTVVGGSLSPYTPLEAQYSGTYEGQLQGRVTGTSAARLVLSVSEADRTAAGVLTNLRSNKSYTFSGEFIPVGEAGSLSARLYERGNRHAANLTANLSLNDGTPRLEGQVRTVLLGQELLNFDVVLNKVSAAGPATTAPAPAQAAPPLRLPWLQGQ
ncbi:hypothetical protein [Deinococcus radiophilus]|uniref:Lipoprotein n=1 Tax=Deinococcus radiophilus TaxID=32062 RepID=A0A3S0L7D5_9DEIO|nr:hypothetical protein [Deinococcus radiophilus]RTR28685.1 hypothetical protein EJ104_04850 [Deinococcus radiophilus]UFA51108.1 hypothetical protein LMT64_04210 [Deinococcus radiophilus]